MTLEKEKAFEDVKPKLPSMRQRIYDTLSASIFGATKQQICKATGIKGTTVTGRLDELRSDGLVYTHVFRDQTHYIATNPENRHAVADLYAMKKMEQWIKRGKKLFPNLPESFWDAPNKEVVKIAERVNG